MSTQHPVRTGSDPATDPPESLIELVIAVTHRPGLPPREMDAALLALAGRIDHALAAVAHDDLPLAAVTVETFEGMGPNPVPLFPVRMGGRTFAGLPDVAEAVERACHATDLGRPAHDMLGRAYQVHVSVSMRAAPADASSPAAEAEAGSTYASQA
ncbi:MAG: hypothetical protein JWM27_3954 [Gemmatimonadetes bacterium]|nr:hypothetical protein [Gemmatimonadota bacterium]